MTLRNLEYALRPRSVAVFGASHRDGAIGRIVMDNIARADFGGPVFAVNPKHREVAGLPCYPDAGAVPDEFDLAVVCTPPEAVPGVVAGAGDRGARAAAVITAGLGEGEGSLRDRMLSAARPHLLRVIGPNCIGLLLPQAGLNASFAHASPVAVDLALLSQSGAIVTTVLDWANARGIGFSAMVSLGDMADVDFGDLLDWYGGDVRTRAILLYVEAVTHPRKFMSAARAAARAKPVVVIKAGRHSEAARAAASHTGALAGVDAVYDAAFRRAGLLRVRDLDEMFDAVETLGRVRPFRGRRLAVVTNGGGVGVLAVDRLIDMGGELAPLSETTIATLDAAMPAGWSQATPVDIVGDAGPERYAAAVEVVLADPGTDAILVMNCPTARASSREAALATVGAVRSVHGRVWPRKPAFAAWLGAETSAEVREAFSAAGMPSFTTPTEAVRGFMHLVRYSESLDMLMRTPPRLSADIAPGAAAARKVVDAALAAGREWLDAEETRRVLDAYAIPVADAAFAADPDGARAAAERLLARHGACAVKIRSPDIIHKSDVGGVRLGLETAEEVANAARSVIESVRRAAPEARIEGVSVEAMIARPGARELILGIVDDALFGPVILFGQGGTAVEVIRDKALALPPLDLVLARDLMERTRVARLLHGFRGEPAADLDAVALTLVKLSQIAVDIPEVRELEVNPLLADAGGVVAVDSRMRLAAPAKGAPRAAGTANPRMAIRPYPAEWERTLELPGGRTAVARPVRPEDEALYETFFAHVEPDDMRLRFFTPLPDLSHRFLARLTQIDYARAMAFVALDPDSGEMWGVVRLHGDPDGESAEFAVMVRSDLKGRGLGWALMALMIDYARAAGVREIRGQVLRQNATMLAMCRQLGFAETRADADPSVVEVRLPLAAGGGA